MPKSLKKRKDKAADFTKAKLKLGKGKLTPTNVVDTSFKVRSIVLPNQSITAEKDANEPTTKKKLTFHDLLTHVKHYSAAIRRDAIFGLRELLQSHPKLLKSGLPSLINACVRMIADEDGSVRKTLQSFVSWLLPQIPKEDLIPHAPVLILFTTSALTHIFPEIRLDTIRFLDILLAKIPECIVKDWMRAKYSHAGRILEGYLGMLSAGTEFNNSDGGLQATSVASVVLTSTSKLLVLQSLASFLHQALLQSDVTAISTSNSWYLSSSFTNSGAHQAFEQLLQPSPNQRLPPRRNWEPNVTLESNNDDFVLHPLATQDSIETTLQQLSDIPSGICSVDDTQARENDIIICLARTLHSTLISTFLDAAPLVFNLYSKPPETEVKLLLSVGNIAHYLYSAILQKDSPTSGGLDKARQDLQTYLGYMANYFPFTKSTGRDAKLEEQLLDLNLQYCELTSLLRLTSETAASSDACFSESGNQNRNQGKLFAQAEHVGEYVIRLLQGEPVSGSQLGRTLTSGSYLALLPTIWSILNSASRDLSTNVARATIDHSIRTSSKSPLKGLTIMFIARITLLETERTYRGVFRPWRTADDFKALEDWISHLPKTLWELGSYDLQASEIILRFLLRFAQRSSPLRSHEVIRSLHSRFIPFFFINHPVRGRLPGPFSRLPTPSAVRRLVLDVVATLLSLDASSSGALSSAVTSAVADTSEQAYWLSIR